jgi:site-specific recombinase XerD
MRKIVEDYLVVRRSLGFKLESVGRQIFEFASFLTEAKSDFITTALVMAWATRPSGLAVQTVARRIGVVRGFAAFARTIDSRNEVPPKDCLPYCMKRPLPYIYSSEDILALLQGLREVCTVPFGRNTYTTLFGLLAVSGMRVGEAIALDGTDFNGDETVLTIRSGKFGKSREVPLSKTAKAALQAYERARNRILPRPKSPAFFLSAKGTRLLRQDVSRTFAWALRRADLSDRKPRRPRIHDLRHAFAVHTLCDWYRAGLNVEAQIPLLSTYLGHVAPSSTYWYLTATPELVGLAAQRLEKTMGELP